MALAARIETDSHHAQVQLPIICGVDQMLEPDFALIKWEKTKTTPTALPNASDVWLIIEAAGFIARS